MNHTSAQRTAIPSSKIPIAPQSINIRDDINFLEYPLWIVAKTETSCHLIIKKSHGFYEIKSTEGLPLRFDKMVLYFLLHKAFKSFDTTTDHEGNDLVVLPEIVTTRYEIAKNVLFQTKNFSKTKYDRIMLSLKKWKALYVRFEGLFCQHENLSIKLFSIIDYVSLDKVTSKLSIKFNDQYITQLARTQSYKTINLVSYKKLTRPVSARLYEILVRQMAEKTIWCISIDELGEQLTLEKRGFPSQILAALRPALEDINRKTELAVEFEYDKARSTCIFKNAKI